jgi:hypothetical protein
LFQDFQVNVGTAWRFRIDEASLVSSLGGTSRAARGDAATVLGEALDAPLDFPSLASASVPGDRIVVCADPLLPDVADALRGVVDAILRAGATADLVTLMLPQSLAGVADAWRRNEDSVLADVQLAVHDPANRAGLAYLASTPAGRPIYLNRLLCDADLLIPVTCVPPPASPRWLGIHASAFPTFSDVEAQARYRAKVDRLSKGQHEAWRREVDEVGWLLGVGVVVGVVPGHNGTVHAAAAGTPARVREYCLDVAREAWQGEVPRRVPLVITLVDRQGGELSWDDFAAALAAARQAAGEEGAVAVCGNFARRPGRSLARLVDVADLQSALHKLHGEAHEDTWAAQELATALGRGPVYFASGLADDVVEGLGMAPVGRPDELARLASHFDECVVIRDAQFAMPHVAEEAGSLV